MPKQTDFSEEKTLIEAARILRKQADKMILNKIRRRLRKLMNAKDGLGLAKLGNQLPDGSFLQFSIFDAARVADGEKKVGYIWEKLLKD